MKQKKRWRARKAPKPGVKRDATTGRSRGYEGIHPETRLKRQEILMQIGLTAAAAQKHALDPMAGTSLGRLRLRADQGYDGISDAQYRAGEVFTSTHRRHAQLSGFRRPSPASGNLNGHSGPGMGDVAETYPGETRDIAKRLSDFIEAMAHDRAAFEAVWAVCVNDHPEKSMTAENVGALRVGLNAIARLI